MIDIHLFKGSEKVLSFQSSVIPEKGDFLWVDDSTLYYMVLDVVKRIDTERKRLVIYLMIK